MYTPKISDNVQTGWCVGLVALVTDDVVRVDGVYRYPPDDEDDKGYDEYWSMEYDPKDLSDVNPWRISNGEIIWDYQEIQPLMASTINGNAVDEITALVIDEIEKSRG